MCERVTYTLAIINLKFCLYFILLIQGMFMKDYLTDFLKRYESIMWQVLKITVGLKFYIYADTYI